MLSLVPAEVAHISQPSWLDQVPGGEEQAEQDAKRGDGDVCQADEGVASADPGGSAEDDRLGPFEHRDGVV